MPHTPLPHTPLAPLAPLPSLPPLLAVDKLTVQFTTDTGTFNALQEVSWQLNQGQCLCLVGESGCGKSMTALALMGLLPAAGRIAQGHIHLAGQDLTQLSPKAMNAIRGQQMSMIFQEPMTSLNPLLRIEAQISEVLILHQGMSKQEATKHAITLLETVSIADAASRLRDFPHQLSGGMRQRVMIAMALACKPKVLIADEPTTALDVTIQSHILHLLQQMTQEYTMGLLLITHNLGVVASMADTVGVMYAGSLVEYGKAKAIFKEPLHPYTQGLMLASPSIEHRGMHRLPTIPGNVPALNALPTGCPFRPRCKKAMPRCTEPVPRIQIDTQYVQCHLYA